MASHHIICEGEQDRAFLDKLLSVRGAPFEWVIRTISDSGFHGISNLHRFLNFAVALRNFRSDTQHIIIVVDADESADAAFRNVQSHLRNSNNSEDVSGYYTVPARINVTETGKATTTVILLPGGDRIGALESLLWEEISRGNPKISQCVEQLIACSGIADAVPSWNQAKADKARLAAAIAVLNREDPTVSLRYLWKRFPDLVSVESPIFDSLYNDIIKVGVE